MSNSILRDKAKDFAKNIVFSADLYYNGGNLVGRGLAPAVT